MRREEETPGYGYGTRQRLRSGGVCAMRGDIAEERRKCLWRGHDERKMRHGHGSRRGLRGFFFFRESREWLMWRKMSVRKCNKDFVVLSYQQL
jgi:hypothetical protein